MTKERTAKALLSALLALAVTAPAVAAPPPTPQQMLAYKPRQEGVVCDTPAAEAVANCKVEPVKGRTKGAGWLLKDASGQPLRLFYDSAERGLPDVYAYYRGGVEVYREIDTTYAGKPDQYRWLNAAGMKWGVDANRDGKIDAWKAISPEEVSQELLAALANKDQARFQAL